jgi:phage tail-like protein
MAAERRDPYRGFNFRVAIGGKARASDGGFASVRLPTLPVRPEIVDAADAALGERHDTHIVLSRGFTGARDLQEWWQQERAAAKPTRGRGVAVDLLDETNTEVVMSWRFGNCRPVALHYSPLDALSSDVVVETIVLTFDDVAFG